jgi:HK97 family phage major capsid protein
MRHKSTLLSRVAPRAVSGLLGVRAAAEPKDVIARVSEAFEDFKRRHNDRLNSVEAAVDDIGARHASHLLNGGAGRLREPDDPEYTAVFASYFRSGSKEVDLREANAEGQRAQIQASMSSGDSSSGGYLAPTEWDRMIRKAQAAKSPMRRLADVKVTGVNAYSTVWNNELWGSGWVGETAARPSTSTPTLSPITFASGEIYANPAITQRLLDDAELDLEKWLATELEEEFNRQEGIAFVSGNGINKPFGFLQYVAGGAAASEHPAGPVATTASGHASSIPDADALVTFKYGLTAPYRQNATWLMNSQTAAVIAKMKDADGRYIWSEGLIAEQPATLLGRPVEIDEAMPNVEADAMPIAFGDFRAGYLINDRTGVRILRDPYTNKPFVMFYSTKRVGAGVQDPRAIRVLRIAAS